MCYGHSGRGIFGVCIWRQGGLDVRSHRPTENYPNPNLNRTPIMWASSASSLTVLKFLISENKMTVDFNVEDFCGNNGAYFASLY